KNVPIFSLGLRRLALGRGYNRRPVTNGVLVCQAVAIGLEKSGHENQFACYDRKRRVTDLSFPFSSLHVSDSVDRLSHLPRFLRRSKCQTISSPTIRLPIVA